MGIDKPSKIELLAKAAFWQGYWILDGFVPVRNMNQTRLANPKISKFLFLILLLLHLNSFFVWRISIYFSLLNLENTKILVTDKTAGLVSTILFPSFAIQYQLSFFENVI